MSINTAYPAVFYVTHSGLTCVEWLAATLNAHSRMLVLHSYYGIRQGSMPDCGELLNPGNYAARSAVLQELGRNMLATGEVLVAQPEEIVKENASLGEVLATPIQVAHVVEHPFVFVDNEVRWREELAQNDVWPVALDNEWARVRSDEYERACLMPFEKAHVGVWSAYQAMRKLGMTSHIYSCGIPCFAAERLISDLGMYGRFVSYLSGGACTVEEEVFSPIYESAAQWCAENSSFFDARVVWDGWPYWKREAFFRLTPPSILETYTCMGYDFSFCH